MLKKVFLWNKDNALNARVNRKKKLFSTYVFFLFFIFTVFSTYCLWSIKNNVVDSSNRFGMEVSSKISSVLLEDIANQKQNVELLSETLSNLLDVEHDFYKHALDIYTPIVDLVKKAHRISVSHYPNLTANTYFVVENKIYTRNGVTGISFYENTIWYQTLLKSPINKLISLEPYTDTKTKTTVFGYIKRFSEKGAVVTIFYPELSPVQENNLNLPKGYSYYLTDKKGKLIMYYDETDHNYDSNNIFVATIFPLIEKQNNITIQDSNINVYGPAGRELSVYSYQDPKSGWYSILTTPNDYILEDYKFTATIFALMVIVFILITCFLLYREHYLTKTMEESNEALKVLGNSYHAIYRISLTNKKVKVLKYPDFMREKLSSVKNYDDFFEMQKNMIVPDQQINFIRYYNYTNIKNLKSSPEKDVGRDFLINIYDNVKLWYNCRALFDVSSDLDEALLTFKLVDKERRQLIEEHDLLKSAIETAHKNEELKNKFFASMSHDLRTPLNGIIGLCTIAYNNISNHIKMKDLLTKIESSSKQLLYLVDTILDVAKPEKSETLNIQPINLEEQLKTFLSTFSEIAKTEKKEFTYKIEIRNKFVKADFPKLRQIFSNLISNSFKYSLPGAKINFTVKQINQSRTDSQDSQFAFKVQDTGIGMTQEFVDKELFTPYARAETLENVSGTGLGMSIVRNLVKKMNGTIRVKSVVNKGTSFILSIPLQIDSDSIDNQIVSTKENNQDKINEQFNLKGLKLLIAEDNELNMEIACDILESRGFIMTKAWNGQEAVDKFLEKEPFYFDAILMDMRMPILNGQDASIKIRGTGRADSKSIPIIAVTANAFPEDISASHAAQMNAHVSKPIDFKVLEKTLIRLLKSNEEEKITLQDLQKDLNLDVKTALDRFSGSTEIYVKYLKGFIDEDNFKEFNQAKLEKNNEKLRISATKLKEISSSLGLIDLSMDYENLIDIIRSQGFTDNALSLQLDKIEKELNKVILSLNRL